MKKYICIHAHFYQPPRENPWLEEVEMQDSAYPYHDWNERITAECYAPNADARILGPQDKILDIVNNYSMVSFNFGPTLFSWLERHRPDVYQAVLEADKASQKRFSGHGSAIAQVYNHMIMPLANRRDKQTQVIWGIRDFESRFHRRPEGMWLSETAVDLETLEILAEQGILFTILASRQAKQVRKLGESKWKDVSGSKIDPKLAYRCNLPSGKAITLFFYDEPIAHDVAFGGLLNNGEQFAQRLMTAFSAESDHLAQMEHIATDGETFGHHHRYGDMALAYCLHYLEDNQLAKITIYGEYLEKYPPAFEVEIFENTSWSCFHGLERWRSNCGCATGLNPKWNQVWRGPLREAMDYLREHLTPLFSRTLGGYFKDPWLARDDYVEVVLNRSPQSIEAYFNRHARAPLLPKDKVRVLKLLEMERHAMLMYTSCGWFFDEISGIEGVQVMQYAARAMQLARELSGISVEAGFEELLRKAPSNAPEYNDGEHVWLELIKPSTIDLFKVTAHYAVSSLFVEYPKDTQVYCYTMRQEQYEREIRGDQKLALGGVKVRSIITWEEKAMSFAVLHLGDHNLVGGVRPYLGENPFAVMRQDIQRAFQQGDIPEVIRLMDEHFGMHNYTLRLLFKDEQRKILSYILKNALEEAEDYFRRIYEHHYPIIQAMKEMRIPLPKILSTTVEFILNTDISHLLEGPALDLLRLRRLTDEMEKWSFKRDKTTLSFVASRKITALMEEFKRKPEDLGQLEQVRDVLSILSTLTLDMDLWKAQNLYHQIDTAIYEGMVTKAAQMDAQAKRWVDLFDHLGRALRLARA